MSISSNFPSLKPSLLLDFANVKALDPRITFTRTTTATYYDAKGVLQTAASGVARFDHNPTTGESLGLLIEEQRTNLLLYSQEFDNAAWTPSGVTVSANAGTSPDGTVTADKVIPTATSTAFKELQQNFSVTSGTTYTVSCFVKADGYNIVQLLGTSGTFGSFAINYDLSTGAETYYSAGTSTVVGRSIQAIGNGWYRVSASVTGISTASGRLGVNIMPASNSVRGTTWTGDGTSGVLFWGAQIETGAFPTSYIPTTSATVTRNADVASMTGTNFSSWFNNAEGALYADAQTNAAYAGVNLFPFVYRVDDGTANNRINNIIRVLAAVTDVNYSILAAGNTQASFDTNKNSIGLPMAVAYKTNDFAFAVGGVLENTDNVGVVPNGLNRLSIGTQLGSNFLNGTIKKIAYYPTRLSNAQLQALTTV